MSVHKCANVGCQNPVAERGEECSECRRSQLRTDGGEELGDFQEHGTDGESSDDASAEPPDGDVKGAVEPESPGADPGGDGRETVLHDARDPLAGDFRIGDPVIDAATGRSMVVVDHLADRADEYDEFDLLDHYAAERTRVQPGDPVIGCIYTASVQSEPTGPKYGDPPYAFPSSRLLRPTVESVDGYDRPYNLVAEDLLRAMFRYALRWGEQERGGPAPDDPVELLESLAATALEGDAGLVEKSRELAEADTFAEDPDGTPD